MSKLRPECAITYKPAIPSDTALFLIRDAVERRHELIHGRLHWGNYHCAMGCFWTDNPGLAVDTNLVDEVAAVNDSLGPAASPKERWKKVHGWLRWKLQVLAAKTITPTAPAPPARRRGRPPSIK